MCNFTAKKKSNKNLFECNNHKNKQTNKKTTMNPGETSLYYTSLLQLFGSNCGADLLVLLQFSGPVML